MNYFVKLNVISMIYAVTLLIPIQLLLNVYRITRITEWGIQRVITVSGITSLLSFIICSLLLFLWTRKWLIGRKACYWTIIMWVPYYFMFTFLIASTIPITHRGDVPNPASGFLIAGAFLIYPLYVLAINFFARLKE
ncbi:hypothetical protein [Bacillus sp. P14.5]|uniref:hypothetical protein n=1 Tax=Bacillus sp. P14.5 TaxID=1983400 RepID=UPI000DEA8C04|nr:hypothetical protein [Bacillus sp. P14.5]